MSSSHRGRSQSLSEELAAFVDRHFDPNAITAIDQLVGGDLNESVVVTMESGDRFVARRPLSPPSPWAPHIAGQISAHRLAEEAGAPVARVVGWDATALLYRYVEGRTLNPGAALWRDVADIDADEVDTRAARSAGRAYGRLHARMGSGLGALQADGGHPGWDSENYFGPAINSASTLLQVNLKPFGIDPSDVELAAAILQSRSWPIRSRLVHGDASPANTIINEGAVAALIDFDAAAWADPAIDLAWWWYHSPSTADHFASGCAETSEQTERETASVYRLRLLLGLARVLIDHNPPHAARLGQLLRTTVSELH